MPGPSICRLAAAERPMVLLPSGRVIWRPVSPPL